MTRQTFSLNRLIIDTPSGERTEAYHVLSRRALCTAMSSYVRQPDPQDLDRWFEDDRLSAPAQQIAADFGCALVRLLVALQETYWRGVQHIWMGGGLMSGKLGSLAIKTANSRQDIAEFHLAPYPRHLGLIGMARYTPPSVRSSLIFDFGGTVIKCGRAIYQDEILSQFKMLPSLPAKFLSTKRENITPDEIFPLLGYIVNVIREYWEGESFVGVCISTHMDNKQPVSQGGYGNLSLLSERVNDLVQVEITKALGQPVMFDWHHDGTAAASAYTHLPASAAITLGTALGGAIVPEGEKLRPMSTTFKLVHHNSD